MNRPFVTMCALVLSAGLLAACGPEEEESANAADATTQEETIQGEVTTEKGAAESAAVEEETAEMTDGEDVAAADTDSAAKNAPEADAPAGEEAGTDAAAAGDEAAGGGDKSPMEVVEATEKGALKNPYEDHESVADEGHKIYMSSGCNGCHGGTGGGGMGPPLTNPVWVYGSDDDTLFRFITLGSAEYQEKYDAARKGSENVVGPMPALGGANIDSADKIWKMISWMRTINPDSANGGSVPEPPDFN